MHTLKNWKARRAGGRITITGTDALTGRDDKIVGVDFIEPAGHGCRAVDKHGAEHRLSLNI